MKKIISSLFLTLAITAFFFTGCKSNDSLQSGDTLRFNPNVFREGAAEYNGEKLAYRAYEGIVYVKNPVDTEYQTINIYIPESYFSGGTVNGYTADTAPIFFPNSVGGYMPGKAGTLEAGMGGKDRVSASLVALFNGMVVAAPGARGRTTKGASGVYTGKAPACIVDLKAAVRYLRYNDKIMPGDAEKIISNGTSAGGALSALLASTGNSKDYEPYLKALGAAKEHDDIFAASVYCPITNLENANGAYEWSFGKETTYQKMDISMLDYHVERKLVKGELTEDEKKYSADMAREFIAYINSLSLKDKNGNLLRLNEDGSGSFADFLSSFIAESAQNQLDLGKDLGDYPFVSIENGKVTKIDLEKYASWAGRQKTPGAFDSVSGDTGENNLFGDGTTDNKHFTDYAFEHDSAGIGMADSKIVRLMNPMNYIGEKGVSVAKNFRIRVGTRDRDTSLAISAILAAALKANGINVDYALPWDVTHSGDYDLDELFAWVNGLCK